MVNNFAQVDVIWICYRYPNLTFEALIDVSVITHNSIIIEFTYMFLN